MNNQKCYSSFCVGVRRMTVIWVGLVLTNRGNILLLGWVELSLTDYRYDCSCDLHITASNEIAGALVVLAIPTRPIMLLTLYYMAATWVQSWRLSLMRSKITHLLTYNGSLVLYKEPDQTSTDSEGMASSAELQKN